ncbi:MAG: undecaprenyl-diphosphate phosphatase [Candidatus Marinimicrobia bacterium]|nr:undecaprenyl-diphosphate phosphatase [Candidatus Neomarinimicrobiota bacterium]
MIIINTVILAIVQGLTEFLPVSSSGHLVLTEALLGITNDSILLEIFLHFGTFLSVLIVFRKDIMNIISSFFTSTLSKGSIVRKFKENEDFRLSIFILFSMIPAGFAGILLKDFFESLFHNILAVSIALITTGAILFSTKFISEGRKDFTLKNTFIIGLAQAFAIIPGISRSGSTISMALFMGISKEKAARFSFIMALPVVFGATLIESLSVNWGNIDILPIVIGTLISFLTGIAAIKLLLRLLVNGKFYMFAWYCFVVGFISLGVIIL